MVSVISVCNSALYKVGADRITDLSDDTKAAIILNECFDQIRDEVLRSHPWNFAKTRVSLTASGTAPVWGYSYQYPLPLDCLLVLETETYEYEHQIETLGGTKHLLTDSDEANILYITRIEDPTLWDSLFCESLAWRLAQTLAYPLSQSITLASEMDKLFRNSISFARSVNGQECTPRNLVVDDWITKRQ